MGESVWWIKNRVETKKGAVVYCATLNEAKMYKDDDKIKKMLDEADLITADGMPLVWGIRLKTGMGERVYGPDLMKKIFMDDKDRRWKHFFLGSTRENLEKIRVRLVGEYGYKSKNIGSYSPEFKRRFNQDNYKKIKKIIEKFKPDIVWVGMGAEKQIVVANRLNKMIKGVVWITVGAAFDFLAGSKKQCPKLIRSLGFEWLFRLINEPGRLGKRYWKVFYFVGRNIFLRLTKYKNIGIFFVFLFLSVLVVSPQFLVRSPGLIDDGTDLLYVKENSFFRIINH